jgi:hypothetical protein
MVAAPSYTVKAVAHAVNIPARRLEGWVERGIIVPTLPSSGTGTRTRFSRQDVFRVAVIAEIQRLFGTDFRPGSIASTIGRDLLTMPWLDTAFEIATREAKTLVPSAGEKAKLTLYVHEGSGKQRSIGATRKPANELLKTVPVLLLIDPAELWRKIGPRLENAPNV